MPSPDSEPENYSIDDMMDRLRSRGAGGAEGEAQLVTREDGTQVYKVRKRKRRSHQPKKEKERMQKRFRVVQIVAAVGLVALIALGFGGAFLYLNTSSYREQVVGRIHTWTGAEPVLTQLRVTPAGAAASSLELKWPEGSVLEHLKLNDISGDLQAGSLLQGKWKGTELFAANGGTLRVRSTAGLSWQPPAADKGECPFQFRYRSNKFSVVVGDPAKPALRVQDSEASFSPLNPQASTANLQFEKGTLELPGWGTYRLNFAAFRFEGGAMKLGSIRLGPASGAKGEIRIANPTDAVLDLKGGGEGMVVQLSRVPLIELLGPAFGTWFSATVETPEESDAGRLFIRDAANSGSALRVPFRSVPGTDAEAAVLPMFERLAKELDDPWFRRPRFDLEARGEAVRDTTYTGIENLVLEAKTRFAIRGKVMAKADGQLEGTLEVGLLAGAVSSSTPEMRGVFSRKGDGYMWGIVKISGTAAAPKDDLNARLASASTSVSPAKGGNQALEREFRELTTPD